MEEAHIPFHMLQHQDTTNQYFGCKVFSTISPVQDTKIIFEKYQVTPSIKWGASSRFGPKSAWDNI